MQITSQFTIAVHILSVISVFSDEKPTSEFLASSIGANPVIIRNVLSKLRKAGIVTTKRGSGNTQIAKPLDQITLYDLYKAVDSVSEKGLFHFHENPRPECPVGRNIHESLDKHLEDAQRAMEEELKKVTIEEIVGDTQNLIAQENKG
ncbi:MAG: Rrf2 family transcriptional regulator [Lachnospiraceae bacterium]|nr:Rrf2 family transcriptional regulator [Lachnospiraceae bacterium]